MNQSDKARLNHEVKTLIDRTLPLVDYGKGSMVMFSPFSTFHLVLANGPTGSDRARNQMLRVSETNLQNQVVKTGKVEST
jgi:hypothetical protein